MSALYLLDTDTCAFILRRSSDALVARIQAVPVMQQSMSVMTYAELLYGVQLSSRKKANQAAVDALTRRLAVLEWPQKAARHYAEIRVDLKKKGAMIGAAWRRPRGAQKCEPGSRRKANSSGVECRPS